MPRSLGLALLLLAADVEGFGGVTTARRLQTPARSTTIVAAKRKGDITRRQALQGGGGGGFDYNEFAEAGLREPLLFGGLIATAAYGLSTRGNTLDEIAAFASLPPNAKGAAADNLPIVAFAKPKLPAKAATSIQVTVTVPRQTSSDDYIECIWLQDESGAVLSYKKFKSTDFKAGPPTLIAFLDKGAKVTAHTYCNLYGTWVGDPVVAAV